MENRSFQNYPSSNRFKEFFVKLYAMILMFIATLFMANPNQKKNNNRQTNQGSGNNNPSFRSSSTPPPENNYASSFRKFGGMGMGGG